MGLRPSGRRRPGAPGAREEPRQASMGLRPSGRRRRSSGSTNHKIPGGFNGAPSIRTEKVGRWSICDEYGSVLQWGSVHPDGEGGDSPTAGDAPEGRFNGAPSIRTEKERISAPSQPICASFNGAPSIRTEKAGSPWRCARASGDGFNGAPSIRTEKGGIGRYPPRVPGPASMGLRPSGRRR